MKISLLIFLAAIALPLWGTTYTPASCSQADVNACINSGAANTCSPGGKHTAVDGDEIDVPAGSCTWTSGIAVPSNIGISIIGAGASSLTITDNITTVNYLIEFRPQYGNSLSRLSGMTLAPQGGASLQFPVVFKGTCTSSGCPNMRVDHISAPSSWAAAGQADASFVVAVGMYGVLDHNTVGDTVPSGNGVDLVNVNFPAWLGVGTYGDNSMHSAPVFGSGQAVYVEANTFNYAFATDSDGGDSYGDTGGARVVCRFNIFNSVEATSACGGHGTESSGRPRGIVSAEFYDNTVSCAAGNCAGLGMRSGTAISGANTYTGSISEYMSMNDERLSRFTAWGLCDGANPHDQNAGASQVYSGTISSTNSTSITFSGTPLVADAYDFSAASPGSTYFFVADTTHGDIAGITSNTSSVLTTGWRLSQETNPFYSGTFGVGDSVVIIGVTLYAAGTHTGSNSAAVLTDNTKSWTTNQYATYNVIKISTGESYQIGANTGTTATAFVLPYTGWTWTNGDAYAILHATQCLDQPSVYGGTLASGEVPAPLPSAQTVLPSYEFDESGGSPGKVLYVDSALITANVNYYQQNGSFDGTTGTGSGALASRPSTCTTGVGYWATDQGSWNSSGSGGQGELFFCTATNTWSTSLTTPATYVPYLYPHPLEGNPQASTPTFSPVAGTYVGTQSVTISAASGGVVCYNTTGAPVTDGASGCTTGTLYSGAVSVSSSETVYAVAGGTGYADSSIGSAAYVITALGPPGAAGAGGSLLSRNTPGMENKKEIYGRR